MEIHRHILSVRPGDMVYVPFKDENRYYTSKAESPIVILELQVLSHKDGVITAEHESSGDVFTIETAVDKVFTCEAQARAEATKMKDDDDDANDVTNAFEQLVGLYTGLSKQILNAVKDVKR